LGDSNLYGLSYPKSPGLIFDKNFAVGLGVMHSHPNENEPFKSMVGDVWVGKKYHISYGFNKPYLIYFPKTSGRDYSFIRRIKTFYYGGGSIGSRQTNINERFKTF